MQKISRDLRSHELIEFHDVDLGGSPPGEQGGLTCYENSGWTCQCLKGLVRDLDCSRLYVDSSLVIAGVGRTLS